MTKFNKWFPQVHQLKIERSESYLHGLFVGMTAPILNLPVIFWKLIVLPALEALLAIGLVLIVLPFAGVFGLVVAQDMTLEESYEDAFSRASGTEL